jgi:hypothetical protein
MNLHAWQTALAALVSGTPLGPEGAADPWLSRLGSTPGFQLTCSIQRWWRKLRVETSAPLTVALLRACDREDVLDTYMQARPESTLYPFQEAVQFLDFVKYAASAEVPHLQAVAQFERAVLLLNRASVLGEQPPALDASSPGLAPGLKLERHPLAALVRFDAPPHDLLNALLSDGPPPAWDVAPRPHWLLVAPCLPNGSRLASDSEARVFATFDHRAVLRVHRLTPALTALWAAGALVPMACSD